MGGPVLDVRRLVLLREVAVRGTLAAVAEALRYSPSAVSQQLTLLEKEAGVPLLRRVGRRVQLTPEAEVLVEAAGEVLDVLERAQSALAAAPGTVRGRVRVAVFQSAALALVPGALSAMARHHPQVRVEVVQREPEQALHQTWAREFDLVVAEQYPAHAAPHLPGLDRRPLTSDAVRLAAPPLAARGGVAVPVHALDDARSAPWVVEPRGTASRHFAEQLCRVAGFEPDVRYETPDLQAQIRLVASGNAVALLPDLVWTGTSAQAPCRLLPLPGDPRRSIFTAVRSAGSHTPAVLAVRAALEGVVAAAAPPDRAAAP